MSPLDIYLHVVRNTRANKKKLPENLSLGFVDAMGPCPISNMANQPKPSLSLLGYNQLLRKVASISQLDTLHSFFELLLPPLFLIKNYGVHRS
jgi:hypothetical protein